MLTLDEYNKLIDELSNIKVDTKTNPFEIGVEDFVKKLNEYKAHLERVNQILLIALKNQAEANSKYELFKSHFEQKVNALLVGDNDVKKEKSSESRRASAMVKLNEDVIKLTAYEQDLLIATSLVNFAKRIYAHLKLLISVMVEERSMFQTGLYLEGKINHIPSSKKMEDIKELSDNISTESSNDL
ncbi:MAG: hypothetical protein QXL51_00090 [Candidatus Aenigmatarchaeota archaeon]